MVFECNIGTDCTPDSQSDRDRLDEIADNIIETSGRYLLKGDSLSEELEDLGWQRLGRGAGRVTFVVPNQEQSGPRSNPLEEADCVVKFAQNESPGQAGGTTQVREEVSAFQRLDPELTTVQNGRMPPFMPISDWDEDDWKWVTMPRAEKPGGVNYAETAGELRQKIDGMGWTCDDIRGDNVAFCGGEPIIIDYGIGCEPKESPGQANVLTDLEHELEDLGCRQIEVLSGRDTATIEFLPPVGYGGPEPVDTASKIDVRVSGDDQGFTYGVFYFGAWGDEDPTPEETAIRDMGREWETDVRQLGGPVDFSVFASHLTPEDGWGDQEIEIEAEAHGVPMPPPEFAQAYGLLLSSVAELAVNVPRPSPEATEQAVRGTVTRAIIRQAGGDPDA